MYLHPDAAERLRKAGTEPDPILARQYRWEAWCLLTKGHLSEQCDMYTEFLVWEVAYLSASASHPHAQHPLPSSAFSPSS